jgi:hypothetical protein
MNGLLISGRARGPCSTTIFLTLPPISAAIGVDLDTVGKNGVEDVMAVLICVTRCRLSRLAGLVQEWHVRVISSSSKSVSMGDVVLTKARQRKEFGE